MLVKATWIRGIEAKYPSRADRGDSGWHSAFAVLAKLQSIPQQSALIISNNGMADEKGVGPLFLNRYTVFENALPSAQFVDGVDQRDGVIDRRLR